MWKLAFCRQKGPCSFVCSMQIQELCYNFSLLRPYYDRCLFDRKIILETRTYFWQNFKTFHQIFYNHDNFVNNDRLFCHQADLSSLCTHFQSNWSPILLYFSHSWKPDSSSDLAQYSIESIFRFPHYRCLSCSEYYSSTHDYFLKYSLLLLLSMALWHRMPSMPLKSSRSTIKLKLLS